MRADPSASAVARFASSVRAEVVTAFPGIAVDATVERRRGLPFWILARLRRGDYAVAAPGGAGRIAVAVGDVLIIPPDTPHRLVHRRVVADALHVRFAAAGGVDPLVRRRAVTVVRGSQAEVLRRAVTRVTGLPAEPPSSFRDGLERHRAGLELLAAVVERIGDAGREEPRPARLEQLAPILERIAADTGRRLGRSEIASWLGMSEAAAAAAFREALGVGPATYARRARMARACDLLAGTALKVRDVAERLGFTDEFSFSRQFKRDQGTSPLGFRRLARPGGGGAA